MSQNSKPQAGDRVRVVPVKIKMPGESADVPATVRDPSSGAVVPVDGVVVRYSPFWARRAAEGAVLIEPAPRSTSTESVDA